MEEDDSGKQSSIPRLAAAAAMLEAFEGEGEGRGAGTGVGARFEDATEDRVCDGRGFLFGTPLRKEEMVDVREGEAPVIDGGR